MCQHNSTCGCGCQQTSCASNCCSKAKTDNIIYSGPTLPCLNISINESLTAIIQILTTAVCANTTTTTTTLVPSQVLYQFEARVFQSTTNDPLPVVVKNDFGTFTTQRTGVGTYEITFTDTIIDFSALIMVVAGQQRNCIVSAQQSPTLGNVILLETFEFDGVTNIDNALTLGVDLLLKTYY